MAIDAMKAKVEIADQLTDLALEVWKYAKENRENITEVEFNELVDRRDILIGNAKEVLKDALEEGTDDAEELIGKLRGATKEVNKVINTVDKIQQVIKMAVNVSKVAATVVSGGTFSASKLFDTLKVLDTLKN